ncbi:YfiR family protein [Acinetobacter qingfengensis]|uniref:Uncharacterized protein n=1 Tax=Acinetobacter qingfengensis TaxID=1262585 RepID=A0A1E7RDD5_9GAMM|nr:YfiR family protein [Acinetobacter qingfengensis]KAA8732157.1 YfiR family protein [Acinetobacter qingfengensis]OEY97237.1 hypothetical protein BJI46_02090 [Acinetobacter qingfengensis]
MTTGSKRVFIFLFLCNIAAFSSASAAHQNLYALSLSILSYSEFPNSAATTFCIVGSQSDTINFQKHAKLSGYAYRIIAVDQNNFLKSTCQAAYFSNTIPLSNQNNLINKYPREPLLSFTSNDPFCESRNIFCLYQHTGQFYFNVNLDSLTQSGIHIDPRVLLLAKNTG